MFSHPRYISSKFAHRFNKPPVKLALGVVVGLLVSGGGAMVAVGIPAGWFVSSLAAAPLMLLVYITAGLNDIGSSNGETMADRLESSMLGALPENPTPYDMAAAAMGTNGGHFIAGRFGIGPNLLTEFASKDANDTETIWQEAMAINGTRRIVSSAVVAVALTRSIQGVESMLAQLQLDKDDLRSGADWYAHLLDLIAYHSKPKRTGGVARDWSFGYTPLLSRFGTNLSNMIAAGGIVNVDLEGHEAARDQIIKLFSQGGRQNVALVGPLGVGKTTVVEAFAEMLLDADGQLPPTLRFNQVISLDPSALISHAGGRGEIEQLVNDLLVEAYRAKNIILCLDNAELFFEDGVGSVNLSNLLLPILEGGAIRMILAMDEQRWLEISQRTPALTTLLNRVVIEPPSRENTIRVLQDQLLQIEYRSKVVYMYQSLAEAYRLSERYIHEQAMPGKALKLLSAAANYADGNVVTAQAVQRTIEQTTGVKVGTANVAEERDKLLNMEQLIHERMINQTRAVRVVSDALRRARAGVRNQDRPIGTFLFLGPTGVGKTELSKALADVYFGGEGKLARLDLNEYVRPEDVTRLIADAATDSHSLTAQVSKQPFSVVLLDEIENAHPNVLNSLLQLLDEGVLRDINNKEVSFRDTIIIATSNAGADRVREYIEAGYQIEQFEQKFIDELINAQLFRPEFLNRFDEILVFRPLTQDELMQVIDLIIVGINKNLALQKMSVDVAEDAKRYLVEQGYDPRLGARPMRRIVQRSVENLIAKRMLGGQVTPGETITLSKDDIVASLQQ